MNIFGVGGTELVIIFLIMLVVAGPKRMVRWAYFIGQYVGKFRQMWSEVVDVMQDEMDAAGVDVKIPKELPTKQNIGKYVTELAKPYTKDLEEAANTLKNPIKATLDETDKSLKDTVAEADKSMKEATADVEKSLNEPIAEKPEPKKVTFQPHVTWGQSKPDKTEKLAKKLTSLTPNKSDNGNGNLGAWSNPKPTSANEGDNGNLGAWSNPQKPTGSSQVEQEA